MSRVIAIDIEKCVGCRSCQLACALAHSGVASLFEAVQQEPLAQARVSVLAVGSVIVPVQCRQCDDAPCAYSCLTGAITRDPATGQVMVDEEKCVGCWTCILVCPFGAIKQDLLQRKAVRCDLCEGEDIPVCVTNCPNEALVYAESDILGTQESGEIEIQ